MSYLDKLDAAIARMKIMQAGLEACRESLFIDQMDEQAVKLRRGAEVLIDFIYNLLGCGR